MKNIFMILSTLLISHLSHAETLSVESCDELYSHRGAADLFKAVDCYQAQKDSDAKTDAKAMLERSLVALSAIINDLPKTESEKKAIAKGLELIKGFDANSSEYFYWHAVFISFQAIALDRGSALPRNTFAVLKTIQKELNLAIQQNPSQHFYGPHRVLGTMHTQMPAIVGGDKKLAENLLKVSYTQAPVLSANSVAYAKILIVNGKKEPAKLVLNRFLSMTDSDLNPYPNQPLRSLAPEVKQDRETAKKMLKDLAGE